MQELEEAEIHRAYRGHVGHVVTLNQVRAWSDDGPVRSISGQWRIADFFGAADGFPGLTAHYEVVPAPGDQVSDAGERRTVAASVLVEHAALA